MLITSPDNPRLRLYKKLGASRSERKKQGLFFCEGDTLYKDALAFGVKIPSVLFREGTVGPLPPEGSEYNELPSPLFDRLSQVETPQNTIFLAEIPPERGEEEWTVRPPVLLDALADPGNMGTVIRTAVAFRVPLIIGEGSADITSPKVVRSAMGALFRAEITRMPLEKAVPLLQSRGVGVLSATLSSQSKSLASMKLHNTAVVIGNEAGGVRREITSLCSGQVIIPMPGGSESLNAAVAASVFMWEMSRGQGEQEKMGEKSCR